MPVVGGYLAFIGYFCLTAGVSLCISKNMTSLTDWGYLFEGSELLLAGPGLLAGLMLTLISRYVKNDAALPLAMVALPAVFYGILFVFGISMDNARDSGWLGELSPPVPAKDLLSLVDFSLVRWDLAYDIFPTWVGMVFVVSFASCLDVAAISMDMGKALDTNKELTTVGIGNCK
jgi:sulfate permease, SulP family